MTIEINHNKIELKQTLKSMLIFEKITERNFDIKTISDVIIYFYSCVIASKKDIDLTFDDFIEWLDNNQNSFADFNEWLLTSAEQQQQLSGGKSSKKKKK